MNKAKRLKIFHYIFYYSAIGWGITFLPIGLLGGLTGGYPLYFILPPDTYPLKVLVTIHYFFGIIFWLYLLFFNGLVKEPLDPDVKLFIHRKRINLLFRNLKVKKFIINIFYLGFSLVEVMVLRPILILDIWFPKLLSSVTWLMNTFSILFFSHYIFGLFFLLTVSIFFLHSYIERKRAMSTDLVKKKKIKKYLKKYKVNSPQLYSLIIKWLDQETEKKFNKLYNGLPKRDILSEQEVIGLIEETSSDAETLKRQYKESKKKTYVEKIDYQFVLFCWILIAIFLLFLLILYF